MTEKKIETLKKSPSKNDSEQENTMKKKSLKKLSPLLITATLTSVSALLLGLYSINQTIQLTNVLSNLKTQNHNNQEKIIRTLDKNLADQANDFTEKLTQERKENERHLTDLNKNILSLNNHKNGDDLTWRLKKVAYFLDMAQMTLHWEKTPNASIELLTSADGLLKEMNEPNVTQLRETIGHEIMQLKGIENIDLTGLLSQLNALKLQITHLPIKNITGKNNPISQVNESPTEKKPLWSKTLNQSIETLSKIIIIRKHETNYQPLLSNQEKIFIMQELKINLKQTEFFLVRQKQALYLATLSELQKNIELYFDTDSQLTQSILTSIAELKMKKITVTLPKLNKSYQALLQLIENNKAGAHA